MNGAFLVSGATGFLGSAVIEELVETTSARIYALVRSRGMRTPEQRLESLWCERPILAGALGARVIAVEADIEQDRLDLEPCRYDELAAEVAYVIHAAAEVGVNQTRQRFWDVNVRGTFNMLEFAARAGELGEIQRFVQVSTAYVAGTRRGIVPEQLFDQVEFNSLYEWSKHEAELLVSSYGDSVPYAIVRPAQIVGDSRTGFITTFNTLYYPLKQYLKGRMRIVPASSDLRVNMVPVDYVARLVCRAAQDDRAVGQVLQAVGREEELPTLGALVEEVRRWARKRLRIELPPLAYVPFAGFSALGRARNLRSTWHPKRKSPLRNLAALAPYFNEERSYACDRARALVGEGFPSWRAFLPKLLEYGVRRGFLNYTGRTVYEQMLMRTRPGASTSIDYYDVGRDAMTRRAGAEVREEILLVARALGAQGVQVGDRVATIGVNSSRYFAVDAAIGLIGAVNVPLYYTSPLADVYDLAATSGATLLLAGTDRMLDGLDLDRLPAKVVAMSDRADVREGIVSWKSFIAAGGRDAAAAATTSDAQSALPWVAPSQPATIRYTSGTTGAPKGVVFTQQQVRWMGETMPAVLDWRTRNARKLRYLSFLPMSHVVEGILVAYAPYYILADIEMYYLNDFSALVATLPKVRPNLFFSVPRFYEKMWNQFASSKAGAYWISLPDNILKRLLAKPLRTVVLRRAGLDRCRQLIVGSAPIGMELLESFRSLGIEIHNAFGVTEAPLITLSRLGDNELGSVGALLPETEAMIGPDGLVYVKGPQVTRSYDGSDEPACDPSGWFCTGDLAEWSDRGNLILQGRKKEILVTSYGKNIAPQKIEMLLKGIDGVSEAMVVADGLPFTSALLWLEDDARADGEAFAAIDASVRSANEQLSHPEQVKRWAIVKEPLTVAAGELTPNLKVRRNVVAETRAHLVALLYGGWNPRQAHDGVLHFGETPM